jgi:hypothetical protein
LALIVATAPVIERPGAPGLVPAITGNPTAATSSATAIDNIVPFIGHLLIKPGLYQNLLIPDKPVKPGTWSTELFYTLHLGAKSSGIVFFFQGAFIQRQPRAHIGHKR